MPADSLHHFLVALPNASVATSFGRFVTPLFDRVSSATKEIAALGSLRDALLPKLISGELRVKDAARFLEAAP